MRDPLAPDFAPEPYWWDAVPGAYGGPGPADTALPAATDLLVVGGGYAGLSAALAAARAGRSVCVVDAREPGFGASSRSVGMIGGRLRQGYAALAGRLGDAAALSLMQETRDAYAWFCDFVADEGIACAMKRSGRLVAAWTARDMPRLQSLARFLTGRVGIEARVLDRDDLRHEIGTDLYHGALLLPNDGGLHPATYHQGLLARAKAAGVIVAGHCEVTAVAREQGGFGVVTATGRISARNVILATNAYTGPAMGWFRRRVIPVGSYMIATEQLPPGVLDRLLPTHRLVNDTRQLAYAFRRAPGEDRLLVGGRASARDHADPRRVARGLHGIMRQLFPELAATRVSRAWGGMVGFTFDRLPHVGIHEGIHYVLGCNGSGIVMNSYLGRKVAAMVVNANDAATGFAREDFPTLPFYTGNAWFMPALTLWYGARDRAARLATGF